MSTHIDEQTAAAVRSRRHCQPGSQIREHATASRQEEENCFLRLFGQQNWGNDATLQAIVFNTRKYLPDAELRCVCTGPDATA